MKNKIINILIIAMLLIDGITVYDYISHKICNIPNIVNGFYLTGDEAEYEKYLKSKKKYLNKSVKNSLENTFKKPYIKSSVVKYNIIIKNNNIDTLVVQSIVKMDHNDTLEILDTWEFNNGYVTHFTREELEV